MSQKQRYISLKGEIKLASQTSDWGAFYFMQEEIWKDIPDYEGLYQVSNLGNVKSLMYNNIKREKILKITFHKSGYCHIDLRKNKIKKCFKVHQLVAMAFLNHKPCGHKLVVDHINDIKTDNRLDNLQIITQRDNSYKTRKGYKSSYKGVVWHDKAKKWVARIRINDKRKHLGLFTNEYDAHLAYQNELEKLNKVLHL